MDGFGSRNELSSACSSQLVELQGDDREKRFSEYGTHRCLYGWIVRGEQTLPCWLVESAPASLKKLWRRCIGGLQKIECTTCPSSNAALKKPNGWRCVA